LLVGGLTGGILGCASDDATITATVIPDGVDREAILNEVEEVRDMLAESASSLPPEAIKDVTFEAGVLRITVGEEVGGLGEAERLCDDLLGALQMTAVSIEVVDETDVAITSCEA
jgi:hypothetical protein